MIAPTQPAKTRRYETREEFMLLVPTHGCFLVRRKSDMVVLTARIYIEGTDRFISSIPPNISADNFRDYEKSIDGGKSWVDCGVEES